MPGVQVKRSGTAQTQRDGPWRRNTDGRLRLRVRRLWLPLGARRRVDWASSPTDKALVLTPAVALSFLGELHQALNDPRLEILEGAEGCVVRFGP